jgi:sugar phosphate isomerase/epimerase
MKKVGQPQMEPSPANRHPSLYGLSAGIFDSLPRTEALAEIARAGFSAVELHVGEGVFGNWVADPGSMRRDLDRAGLLPWSVHSPGDGWDLAAKEEQARLEAMRATRSSFRPARDLGASVVICHCNAPKKPFAPGDFSAGLARTRQSLEVLAEEAGRVGVRLAVETMIPRPDKRPGTRVSELLQLIASLGEHVGICLDTGHSHAAGADVAEEAILAGAKLFSVHIQDNHGRFNEDEHLLPGQGTIDWGAFLAALDRMAFKAPRIFEVKLLEGPDGPRRTLAQLANILSAWQGR